MVKDIKFVPVAPKTYEVRYVENKQSGLSPAARNKVIKMHGSDYLSSRATITSPSYGPGVDGAEVSKWCGKCQQSKEVNSGDAYCPNCGTSFGTITKSSTAVVTPSSTASVAASTAGRLAETAAKEGGTVHVNISGGEVDIKYHGPKS